MKNQVLALLQDQELKAHEKFNKAFEFYRKHKFANQSAIRMYNRVGATVDSLKNLTYDLQQLYGITDVELRTKILKTKPIEDKNENSITDEILIRLNSFDVENADYHKELKPFAAELSEKLNVNLENQKADTLKAFIKEHQEASKPTFENPFSEADADAKEGLTLRQEFPFLNDDDCPDKLKILVSDKLTAFEKVVNARESLFLDLEKQKLSNEEIAALCKDAVVNLKLNEDIYKELDYYNEHKELLMEHPIFEEERLQREVKEMSDNDAHKKLRNLKTYISKEKRNLENAKNEEKKKTIKSKIAEHETLIALIEKKLGLNDKE